MASSGARSLGPNTVEQSLPQVNVKPLNGVAYRLEKGDVENLAICSSPGETLRASKRKPKKASKSALTRACAWVVDRQLSLSILVITSALTAHNFFPSLRWETEKIFHMQYYNPRTGRYGKGWDDMFFVLFWIVLFFGIRVAFMDYMAAPFAKWANIKSKKDHVRFAEQAWVFVYDGFMWSLGFYIIYNSVYWMNLDGVWYDWPDRENDGLFKWYYLVQFAFWLQQIVVVNIEERRKDHWQMFTHHLITSALMFGSYAYDQGRIGNVFLCLMDFVDILLALAKLLRYLGLQTLCDCTFGLFIVGWIATRHVLYGMVCWNIWARSPKVLNYGCYTGDNENKVGPLPLPDSYWWLVEPLIDPTGRVCVTHTQTNSFLVLLLALQGILLLWLYTILRLAWRVISGASADDPRSDDEEEEEEEEEKEEEDLDIAAQKITNGHKDAVDAKPLEEEVGVEQMHFRSKPGSRSGSRASGVQLPVKKELLNRVGCDTKTTK